MTPVSNETIESAIAIIGEIGISEDEIERRVRELVPDDMTARRLIDWIPESFGLVLVSHLTFKINLPTTFSAMDRSKKWVELKLTVEPIFTAALQIAQQMIHGGPSESFLNVALRGSIATTVNNALNAGADLDGCSLSGPALIGIPAEIYSAPPESF